MKVADSDPHATPRWLRDDTAHNDPLPEEVNGRRESAEGSPKANIDINGD
jgi:hypothetical protein